MTLDEREAVTTQVENWFHWSSRGSKTWSCLHHATYALASVLSLIVAFILQLPGADGGDPGFDANLWGGVLALTAAILSTVSGNAGFERKWKANRLTRSKVNQLKIDLTEPAPDYAAIRKTLKTIIGEHNRAILGQET